MGAVRVARMCSGRAVRVAVLAGNVLGDREQARYRDFRNGVVLALFFRQVFAYIGQTQQLKDLQNASERWLRGFFERNFFL